MWARWDFLRVGGVCYFCSMRRRSTYIALAILLIHFGALAGPGRKISVTGFASEDCSALFRRFLPQLVAGDVEASAGTLSQLRQIMRLAGATPLDQEIGSNSIFHIMKNGTDSSILGQITKDLADAFNDEKALSICVLHGSCNFGHGSSAVHVSAGHSYKIASLFGGAPSDIPARIHSADPGEPAFWQAMVLKFKPTNGGDPKKILKNMVNFYHEAAHYSDTLLLHRWAKAIQAGAPVHPKLKKMISQDGKIVDEGFIRLFTESRAEIAEMESTLAFYAVQGVPNDVLARAAEESLPALAGRALGSIDKYGTIVDGAKRELGIDRTTVLQRAYEIEQWIQFSLPLRSSFNSTRM